MCWVNNSYKDTFCSLHILGLYFCRLHYSIHSLPLLPIQIMIAPTWLLDCVQQRYHSVYKYYVAENYCIFSNFLAEQKAVQSRQLGTYGSQPEARRNIRKLQWLIKVRDGIQNGGILVSGQGTTWLEELGYKLFLLWWRRWTSHSLPRLIH